ncbi:sensor histidine kinase [Allonocardiopsis opalescens]|uniref:Signal transduction histidine kinase n=1 Tax=Allonocardiopsis opalescens TaxID=1144618 RepID=A0A2T0PVE2_9ACTN|nr:histidine kinase [Allonocardiopsis opalescens]PRX95499.1 signal transduction histidine kinase [Allonocardiopsis opalescens]
MSDVTAATRFGGTLQLLMHLRLILSGIGLLLIPQARVSLTLLCVVSGFAVLTWLVSRYWERLTPYLVHHPLLTVLDAFIAAVVLTVAGPSSPFFIATVLTATVAGLLLNGWGVLIIVGFQTMCYAAALTFYLLLVSPGPDILSIQDVLINPVLYPVAGFVGLRLRRIFDELESEQRGRQIAERDAAAAQERARLAREMHDSLAKTLRGIAMTAQALPVWITKNPERAATEAARIASATELASAEARELISELRIDNVPQPFGETVRQIATEWASTGSVELDLRVDELSDALQLEALVRHEAVSILREALVNVDRHSDATSVSVSLETTQTEATLHIHDNGSGFVLDDGAAEWFRKGHYGLVGMYERAERAKARLDIDSAPGKGTSVRLQLPGTVDGLKLSDPVAPPRAISPMPIAPGLLRDELTESSISTEAR